MARGITAEQKRKIADLHKANPDEMGPALGDLVYKNNIPPSCVAAILEVTEPTVYRWFYLTAYPQPTYHKEIRGLIAILRKAEKARELPLIGTFDKRASLLGALIRKYRTPVPTTTTK